MKRTRVLETTILVVLVCCLPSYSQPSSPIVIVPGILGNQIEGKLNNVTVPHSFCTKTTTDYQTLWLAVFDLIPGGLVDCLSDNLKLVHNKATGVYSNARGVDIRIPGFGNTSSVEYLDPNTKWFSVTQYFHAMVQHFVDKGYTRGKDIVGAPYDWRYSPTQYLTMGYYSNLKKLIETTYSSNGNQPVVLIAHSMGAPTTLFFLTKVVDQQWKDLYIRDYITISGVWRGTAKAAKSFTSGDNEGIWIVPAGQDRAGQRTYPANAWLLPYPSDTWTKDNVFIITPQRNYSAWDYEDLFTDMGYERGYEMFKEIAGLTGALPAPNVTLHCLYGTKVKTPFQYIYTGTEFPDHQPKTIWGDGDGSVNINSLMACHRWQGQQKYDVSTQAFPGVEHVHTIKNDDVITYVDNIVYRQPQSYS